jgi:hypothetical protein
MNKGEYTTSTCLTKSAKAHRGKFEKKIVQECEAVKKGEYTNSACTTKAAKKGKGKFEKTKGRGYTSTGGKAELATPDFGSGKVICDANTDVGEYTGNTGKTDVDRVTFTGCSFEGLPCQSAGPNSEPSGKSGVIITDLLDSRLVDNPETIAFLNAETNTTETKGPAVGEVWEELKGSQHANYSSEFECGGVVFLRTTGQDTGVVLNAGVMDKAQEVAFEAGKGADGLLTEVLTEAGWQGPAPSIEEAGIAKVTNESAIEIEGGDKCEALLQQIAETEDAIKTFEGLERQYRDEGDTRQADRLHEQVEKAYTLLEKLKNLYRKQCEVIV